MNISLTEEAKMNIWLGKGLLGFGIAFNAFLGFTVGYALLAFATAIIVALMDFAKVRMVRNAVLSWRMGSFLYAFSAIWVLILTGASITAAVMFYAYNMNQVAKQAHDGGADVQLSKQAFSQAQKQAESLQGFDVLGTQKQIAQLESQAAALLAKPATNSSGRSVGNIGGRTDNCSGSKSYYAGKYANECSQYVKLKAEASALRAQVGTATTLQTNATQATTAALNTMADFRLSEGIAGIAVLANLWYPDLYAADQEKAEQQAFKTLLIAVALITELLATSLLIYGYLLGTSDNPSSPNNPKRKSKTTITGNQAVNNTSNSSGTNTPTPHPSSAFTSFINAGHPSPFGASLFTWIGDALLAYDASIKRKSIKSRHDQPSPDDTEARAKNREIWRKAMEERDIPLPEAGEDKALETEATQETINNILGAHKANKSTPQSHKRRHQNGEVKPPKTDELSTKNASNVHDIPLNLSNQPKRRDNPNESLQLSYNQKLKDPNRIDEPLTAQNHSDAFSEIAPCAHGLPESEPNREHTVKSSLYEQWVKAVNARECRASVRNTRLWIQKRIAPTMTGSKTNDPRRFDAMRKGFFSRAIAEGLMTEDPNWTNGKSKFIWKGGAT